MNNEVTNFMYYMYNRWNMAEAKNLFGNNLGQHIYEKWMAYHEDNLRWYAELDVKCRQMLVDRANEIFNN